MASSNLADKSAVLTKGGKTAWKIFLPARAGKVERFAAGELQKYVQRMSGAKIAIAGKKAEASGNRILIGLRKDLGKFAGLPAAREGFDGYSVLISPKTITIAGENSRGVLFGVYDILERLGCRWYHPTMDPKDPEVVPKNADLSLAAGKWSEAAQIEYRWYNGSAFFFWMHKERLLPQIDWAAKNRFSGVSWQVNHHPGSMEREIGQMKEYGALDAIEERGLMLSGPCHSFPFFLSTEEYFKDHPEWFGMNEKGERRPHGGEWPSYNYCWSNAEANEQLIRNMEAFVKRWPQLTVLATLWIDGGKVCQCPECQKRGGANLIVELLNQISDRLEKSAPKVTVETVCGYPPIEEPPRGSQPNGKWMAIYAHWGRNHKESYDDPFYSRKANMLTWASYFPGMFEICSYYAASSHETMNGPAFLHALEGDTKFCVEHKVKGHYILHYPHGFWWNFSFNNKMGGLHGYYYPNRTPKEELRDYAMHYFGPNAGPLLYEYFEMMGSVGENNLEVSYRASRGEAKDSDMHAIREWDKMLERAAYLVRDDAVYAYRVAKQRATHEVLALWGQGQKPRKDAEEAFAKFEKGEAKKKDVMEAIAKAREAYDHLVSRCKEIELQFAGVIEAEWLDSWYGHRHSKGPLDGLEKKLEGRKGSPKSARPDHVAGPSA